MMTRRSGKSMTASEVVAALAHDPDYQEMTRQREHQLAIRASEVQDAELHIVADLRAAGMDVQSVWDLVNTSEPYPTALPILMRHLLNGRHPEAVTEGLARALAVKPAVQWWSDFQRLYLSATSERDRESYAVTLAATADADHLDDLRLLLSRRELGASRALFLRPLYNLAGADGRIILKQAQHDPDLAREARAILKDV